jgi:hypothetical protein
VGLYDPNEQTGGTRLKMLEPAAQDHMMLGTIQVK